MKDKELETNKVKESLSAADIFLVQGVIWYKRGVSFFTHPRSPLVTVEVFRGTKRPKLKLNSGASSGCKDGSLNWRLKLGYKLMLCGQCIYLNARQSEY